jgi:hypothetical protein
MRVENAYKLSHKRERIESRKINRAMRMKNRSARTTANEGVQKNEYAPPLRRTSGLGQAIITSPLYGQQSPDSRKQRRFYMALPRP